MCTSQKKSRPGFLRSAILYGAGYIRPLPSWFHTMRMITAVKLPAMAPQDHQRAPFVRWAVDARPSVPGDIEWHTGPRCESLFCLRLSAANSAHRKANRSRWIPSGRLRQPLCERDRISGIRRFAGRSRMVQSRLLKATSELERISDSGGVREAKDMLMVLGDIRACCTLLRIRRERDTLCHRWLPMAGR